MAIKPFSITLVLVVASISCAQAPVTLRVCGWNVEGNGNDIAPALIKSQLAAKDGIDIWGLSEVRPNLFDEFKDGAEVGEGAPFGLIEGSTGNNIRLAILFDTSILQLVNDFELTLPEFSNHRAPLVAHFRGLRTDQEFLFMVNHLASGNASSNLAQANSLNVWANQQTLPVINVGDFNFRLNLSNGTVRPGLDVMTNGPWHELQPIFQTRTQANFNSILDHVFIANRNVAVGWTGEARILNRSGDSPATTTNFSDSSQESDHRPVDAILTLNPVPPSGDGGDGDSTGTLADRITNLEERMTAVEDLLQQVIDLLDDE